MKNDLQIGLFEQNNNADLPVYTVAQLRDEFSRIIKNSFKSNIIVKGVISSQPKLYPSYVFFDIKDDKKNMSFTVYGYLGTFYNIENKIKKTGAAQNITAELPVMLIVQPTVSTQKNISLRLNIIDIIPEYTSSVLASTKDITIKKLIDENLFDKQKQLKTPIIYKKLGLITSDQGTSVQDISTAMGSSIKYIDIIFKASRVEGTNAVASIIEAINLFNKHQKKLQIDALIIARGGGSSVDLAVFNDYSLCKSVCNSKIPIITAIGHDKDEHAIELCSFLTPMPSTPTGIGTYIKEVFMEAEQSLSVLADDVVTNISDRFYREQVFVKESLSIVINSIKKMLSVNTVKILSYVKLTGSFVKNSKYKRIELGLKNIYTNLNQIKTEGKKIFVYNEERLLEHQKLLDAYNHSAILKRGYSITKDEQGSVVKSVLQMPDTAMLEFYDGDIKIRRDQ